IIALHRKVFSYHLFAQRITDRRWQEYKLPPIRRAANSTVGIIGVGRIGTSVINRLKPFGYRILGYDPYVPSGHEKAIGYTRVWNLSELLKSSDIISVHTPLTPETTGMIDEAFIDSLKDRCILVN